MTRSAHKRLEWVDAARGIAALSVTLYHFQIGNVASHVLHLPWLLWLNWPGSRLAVPLFFVISGFSIHYAERDKIHDWVNRPGVLKSYFLRRLWRVYPPYVAALLLALGINWTMGETASLPDLAAHLLMVHPFLTTSFNSINVVFWSIGVEVWLYLLYPFALRLLETCGLRVTGAVVFLISALSIVVTVAVNSSMNVVGMWFVLNLFFGWCMGAAVAEGFVKGNFFFLAAGWWLVGAAMLSLHLGVYFAGGFAGRWWPVFIPSVVVLSTWGFTLVILLERRQTVASHRRHFLLGALRWLGAISYSLYLVHEPLINVRGTVLDHLPNRGLNRAVFGLWYAVPFVVAWLCWLWVEKPSMRISKRLLVRA